MKLDVRWMVLCTVGLAAGLLAATALGAPIEAVVGMMLVTPVAMAIAGAVLGTSQWFVLRQRIPRAGWWIPASAIGLGIGITLGVVTVELLGRALTNEQVRLFSVTVLERAAGLAVTGSLAGFCLGCTQWLMLRRHTEQAGRWILATTLGLGSGLPGGGLVSDLVFTGIGTPVGLGVLLLVAGSTFGAATWMALGPPQVTRE